MVIIMDNKERYKQLKIENDEITCLSYGTCEIYISIDGYDEVEPLLLILNIYELVPSKIECEKEIKMHIGEEIEILPKVDPESSIWTFNFSTNNKNGKCIC